MVRSHVLQKLPARAPRPGDANTLAAPRAFGPAGVRAPGTDAARLGHDFARVAVRRNETGLDDRLKAGIERLSGVTLDDVRVHYRSPRPARVQAAAFTQGTHIHVAPGQERHLAHEVWHVVQQKQGRVRATGRVAGLPLNDAAHLEREASVMGAKALAAGPAASPASASAAPLRQDAGAGAGPTSAPVQAWRWPWEKAPDPRAHYKDLSESDRQKAVFLDNIHENEVRERQERTRWGRGFFLPEVQSTTESHALETAQTVAKVGSGVIGKTGEALALTGSATTGVADTLGAVGSGVGVLSSTLSAASGIHSLATDETRAGDKALTAGGVLSDLGSATTTLASGTTQAANAGLGVAKSVAPVLGAVAGPVAMARGGLDIVRGTAQAGLAGYRRQKLAKIEDDGGEYAGVARFAKQNQTTKVVGGVGTAIGGGLALAGGLGIAGLALSGPVGWGLLAGAAGVGAGMAAYKKYRKHQIGKQLGGSEYSEQLADAGIHVPTDEELAPTSTWGKVKNVLTLSTTEQRRYDAVRGHIGQKLAKNEDSPYGWDPAIPKIIKNIGLKPKAKETTDDSSRLYDPEADARREEAQKKRAKHIARALQG